MKTTLISTALATFAAWFTLAATAEAGGYGRTGTSYGRTPTHYHSTAPRATFSTPAYPYHGASSLRSAYSKAAAAPRRSYRPTLSSRYATGISRHTSSRRR
jgi:hypothetical protein